MTNDLAKRIAALSPEQRDLFERRLKQRGLKITKARSIPKRNASDPSPLSLAQERFWILHQLQPDIPLYNESILFRFTGQLNSTALEQSLNEIIRRHEILRTSFQVVEGQPVQIIAPTLTLTLPVVDLQELPETEQGTKVQQLASQVSNHPFDLTLGPLLRGTLLRLGEREHVMLLTMHHIISDGWTRRVFFRELAALYQAFCHGVPSPLPELPIQYADFALWQRQWLEDEVHSTQLAYWKQQLDGALPVLALPTDYPRPAVQTFRGARETLILPHSLTDALKALSQKKGVTLFMLLLAAFKTLLYRYTGQEDILVGTPIANRTQIETETLVGCFVNTLVLRTDLHGNPSFLELLNRVRGVSLGAFAHQDLPFEQLVKELQQERVLSHNPLFQVMFVFQDTPLDALELPGLTLQPMIVDSGIAKFDLTLFLEDTKQGLIGALEYNTDLFNTGTITRMLGHFQTLLTGIAAAPGQCLKHLPLLTEAERHQLIVEWNDTTTDYPQDQCIHELFEDRVEQTPDAVALVFEDQQLTYRQLNQRANKIAHYLRRLLAQAEPSLGVGAQVLVGICVERSLEMVVGLLGILKAGAAYVPLDPEYPPERLAFMLEDAQVPVLLTQQKWLDCRLTINSHPIVVCLDTDWQAMPMSEGQVENLSPTVNAENLAYAIYTSGSTGLPKGAMNTHRGLSNRLHWMQQAYQLTPADRVLQKTPFSFDVSVWEFFWPLLNGACLVMARPGGHQDCTYLVKLIAQQQITTIHFVPSMLQVFIEEPGVEACSSLKRVICSGEALPLELQKRFFTRLSTELHNLYGPTEAAIDVTFWACQRNTDLDIVPIGRPIANTQIYLLDDHLQPVPIGIPGELHIGGVGLARGYLNRPDLTAEKFIANPFVRSLDAASYPQARLYKTGDLARYRQDGSIEFLGRIDHQVKIRGFRIELAEIEAVLGQHPAVRETVVMAQEDELGDKRLVAYVVSYPELAITGSTLRNYLKENLPDYMVPSVFVLMDALPLTSNGKVDRRALPALLQARPELEETFVAPSTPVEELLAAIWAQILGIEQVGIHDNFFELGGHSLLATQVISQLRKVFQVELPLRCLFEAPTVKSLSEHIETAESLSGGFLRSELSKRAMKAEPGLQSPPIKRVSREVELPLSFAQQRLWFLHQLDPDSAAYNGPTAVLLQGPLNLAALEQSISEIVRRHEALRTCFAVVEGRAVQKIVSAASVPLPVVELQNLPETEREAEVQRHAMKDAQQPFDLTQAPLLRVTLLRLDTEEHVLLLTMHHIISDAWSGGVFIREVSALYEAFSTGKQSPLSELPIQYADFAVWQQQWLQGEVLDTQLAYWKQQLGGAKTVLELPTARPRSRVQTATGTKHSFVLSPGLSESLKSLSQQEGATLFMTLLAAFNTLLYRYTGQEDILVGSPIANRNQSEIEGLIGFFVNTLVLRTDLSSDPSFRELMQRVREVSLGAYTHQDLPFEKLVAELQPERNLSHAPLFQVWFVLQNTPMSALELSGLTLSLLEPESGMVRHDLKLDLSETPQGLKGFFEYKTDLFDPTTIARMAVIFETLLATVIEQPDLKLSQLVEILDEAEQKQQILKNQEFKQARRQKLGNVGRKAITGIGQ
jgi:amino acid adenylation domain-containing protein